MCEEFGYEPNPDEMPIGPESLSPEGQVAAIIFSILPDKFEGMSGTWLGKDFAGLFDILRIYKVPDEDQIEILELLNVMIHKASEIYAEKQRIATAQAKAESGVR